MSNSIDALALVVSLGALGVSICTLKRDSKERRLAATPHLIFNRLTNERDRALELTLTNNGLGPAELSEFSYMLDGKAISLRNSDQVQDLADSLQVSASFEKVADLQKGGLIAVGQTLPILHMLNIRLTDPETQDLRSTVGRLSVGIQYRSIYGDMQPQVNADDRCE